MLRLHLSQDSSGAIPNALDTLVKLGDAELAADKLSPVPPGGPPGDPGLVWCRHGGVRG
jgi:hypothetical protein